MTSEETKVRDEQLMASLVVALIAGHAIENHDRTLRIERADDQRFAVRIQINDLGLLGDRDDLFEDARSAVAYYLDLCDPA
jgi:hypothetical protein